ncbi:MAG: hypothetical protein DRQ55_02130 [Planctomycetota bacterium]|nr:MAG: hypothetical protein DRQ55_02130 [Planctomycetota bacterium]
MGARRVAPVLVLLCACALPATAQLSLDVNAAIARGVEVLRTAQRDDGSFAELARNHGHVIQYPMGTTALALYTLRKSGLRADDPAITRALSYLDELPLLKTYSVASYVFALASLHDPAHDARITRLAGWLEQHFDKRRQQWGYPDREPELSNTQFAVLALAVAARHGHETAPKLWSQIIDGALTRQQADGGFNYRANLHTASSGGMATAGITTLHVAREQLAAAGSYDAHQRKAQAAIERAWRWLDQRFASSGCPAGTHGLAGDRFPYYERDHPFHYYYLYGIERVAALSGRKTIGGLPWYRLGALDLLAHEAGGGGWSSLPNTCLALLFLRRATISGGGATAHADADEAPDRTATQAGERAGPGDGASAGDRAKPSARANDGDGDGDARTGSDIHTITDDGADVPSWAYTTEPPPKSWLKLGFDDGDWARGRGGFGSDGAVGLTVRTPWTGSDLWVRRSFRWSPGQALDVHAIHDDSVSIWINGVLAGVGELWSGNSYRAFPLSKSVLRTLRAGDNVIAAHVRDTGGARSLDISLDGPPSEAGTSAHWRASLPQPEVPFVRRWLVSGPHADKDGERMLQSAAPGEAPARAGERLDGKVWRAASGLSGRLDLGALVGLKARTFGYLATQVHVAQDWQGYLWLGADGGVRAWLDDQAVAHLHEHVPAQPTRLRASLKLSAGWHRLLIGVEAPEGPPELFVRLADQDGGLPAGLSLSLLGRAADAGATPGATPGETSGAAPGATPGAAPDPSDTMAADVQAEQAAQSVAHAALFELPDLAQWLPITNPRALELASLDDLAGIAITPAGADTPRWLAKPDKRAPGLQPPPGAKGMLALRAPGARTPMRLLARVSLPDDTATLTARVARVPGSDGAARLRLGLFDGALRWLGEPTLLSGEAPKRKPWQNISVALGQPARRDVLLVLELSALDGAPRATLFVDRLQLR